MKVFAKFLPVVIIFCALAPWSKAKGGNEGRGGAGVIRNGQFLTLGEAKIKISNDPLLQVPSLTELLVNIDKTSAPTKVKDRYMEAAFPSSDRRYYQLEESDLNKNFINNLLKNFRKLIKDKKVQQSLVLYAFTTGKDTFLLPTFLKLNPIQQQIILFHEISWVINPNATYDFIIKLELAFENLLRNHLIPNIKPHLYDEIFYPLLNTLFSDDTIALSSAIISDQIEINPGSTQPPFKSPFKGSDLIGDSFDIKNVSYKYYCARLDQQKLARHLITKIRMNPSVAVFKELYRSKDLLRIRYEPGDLVAHGPSAYLAMVSAMINSNLVFEFPKTGPAGVFWFRGPEVVVGIDRCGPIN